MCLLELHHVVLDVLDGRRHGFEHAFTNWRMGTSLRGILTFAFAGTSTIDAFTSTVTLT